MKRGILTIGFMAVWTLLAASSSQGASIEWVENSRTTAFNTARAQGKMVFLLSGNPGCGNCNDVHYRAVNVMNPPLNQMIEECFVAWYNNNNVSTEDDPYEAGLGGYSLPLYCWSDPKLATGTYMDRRTGPLDDPILLTLMRKALRKASPNALNLTNNQVVGSASYVVQGRLFTNLIAKQFFYKVNGGGWIEATTDGPTEWKTSWSAPLAGQSLTTGAGNKFYAYAVYSDNTKSTTNTLTFTYTPGVGTTYTLAGRVTSGGVGLAGVTVSDGATLTTTTSGSGDYTLTVSDTWTGTVTPSLSGYSFAPANRAYATALTANMTGQDFTATAIATTFTIGGRVTLNASGLAGVTVSASTGPSTNTDAGGYYVLSVPSTWTGTVTPSLTSHTFAPVNRSYPTPLTANQTGQDYAATSTAGYPQITGQPVPTATLVGGSASFTVTASNASTYAWYRQGDTTLLGTTATLNVPSVGVNTAGSYYCVIGNAQGNATSQAAGLAVYEFAMFPGVKVYGAAGQAISLSNTTNLQGGTWVGVTNRTLTAPVEYLIDYNSAGASHGFYKLQSP